jgi:hypothetical protein
MFYCENDMKNVLALCEETVEALVNVSGTCSYRTVLKISTRWYLSP